MQNSMIQGVMIRYAVVFAAILSLFVGFVACGSEFYKVSLENDHQEPESSGATGTNDPTSLQFGLHAPNGWQKLPIRYRISTEMEAEQIAGLKSAMQTWETAIGKQIFSYEGLHEGVVGDSFPDLYSSLGDHINGHYLDDNWGKTGKPKIVLATTIWSNIPSDAMAIDTADIRFNSDIYFIADSLKSHSASDWPSGKELVDMQSLALHELGHFLGLAHVDPGIDPSSIMNPSLFVGEGLANRRLSVNDIIRIQRIYGCSGTACDAVKIAQMIQSQDTSSTSKKK